MPPAELLAPNLHVALIHYPLGLLVVGLFIELFAFLWPRSTARIAGRWLIGIGALSAVPAAFSGIYALRQIARVDMAVEGRSWADVKAASPVLSDGAIWSQMQTHSLYQSISTGVAVLAVVVWLGCGDVVRAKLRWPILLVLLGSLGGMMVGAWFSGEAIYKHGAGVDHGWPAADADTHMPAPSKVESWFPPIELHLIAAGSAVALSLAAVGLSFRKLSLLTADQTLPVEPDDFGSADVARSFNPNLELERRPMVPTGRAWTVAFLVAFTTALGGLWVLFRASGAMDTTNGHWAKVPAVLWQIARPDTEHGEKINRLFSHLIMGSTIVLLPAVLALLSRFGPRRRGPLAIVTGLLTLAVAAQVWLGVLLLYDGQQGPINQWNAASTEAAQPANTIPPPPTPPPSA